MKFEIVKRRHNGRRASTSLSIGFLFDIDHTEFIVRAEVLLSLFWVTQTLPTDRVCSLKSQCNPNYCEGFKQNHGNKIKSR